jgi:hypothetical protein
LMRRLPNLTLDRLKITPGGQFGGCASSRGNQRVGKCNTGFRAR